MCGCMLMHAMMDHEGHQHAAGAAPLAAATVACAHCGFPLEQGFRFCPDCGMGLRAATCEACGQKVDSAWKACAYCGSPLGAAVKAGS